MSLFCADFWSIGGFFWRHVSELFITVYDSVCSTVTMLWRCTGAGDDYAIQREGVLSEYRYSQSSQPSVSQLEAIDQ